MLAGLAVCRASTPDISQEELSDALPPQEDEAVPPSDATGADDASPAYDLTLSRRTFLLESLRNVMFRPVMMSVGGSGLLVTVAIQHFDANKWTKGLLGGAVQMGMLLTPLVVWAVAATRLSVSRAIALSMVLSALGLFAAANATDLNGFFLAALIGIPLAASTAPLFTALWRQNIPGSVRGQRFAQVSWIGTISMALVSFLIGKYMGDDPSRFRLPVIGLAIMMLLSALVMLYIPTQPLRKPRRFPLPHLSLLIRYPLFGYISMAWMLMGFANLATMPLRNQFADGQGFAPEDVVMLTLTYPTAASLASMLIWGWLFDKMNFLLVRIGINVMFGLSLVLFFQPEYSLMVAGSVFFGLAIGGGTVAWAMWVTKYSPADRTADFMAVHTFLTGLRGTCGPLLGFLVLEWVPFQQFSDLIGSTPIRAAAWIATALIIISCAMLIPVIHTGRRDYKQPPR